MFRSNIICHLADMIDFGLDESLDCVQATGATGLTVIVTSGPVVRLRSNPAAEPRILRTQGGYFYHFAPERYENTRAKPIASSRLKGRDSLAEVADGCRSRGLEMRVRMSAFETGRIGQRHGDCLAKTVFGDPAADTLCPANPDVRALVLATVADLAERYSPSAVEIADLRYHSGAICDSPLEVGFEPARTDLSLLAVCFCESSRQWAVERGADPPAAARSVQTILDRSLASGRSMADSWETLLDNDQVLNRYVECQQEALDTLLDKAIAAAPCPVLLVRPPETASGVLPSESTLGKASGAIVQTGLPISDGLEELVARATPGAPVVEVEFEVADVSVEGSEQLVSASKQAAEMQLGGVGFSNLGVIPESVFTTIKQAIRYAARST